MIRKRPWKQHPSHTQISEKKLILGKQGIMAWLLEEEKDSFRVGGSWRGERGIVCFRCRWKTWPLLPHSGQTSAVPTHGYQVSWSLEPWPSLVQGSVHIQKDQIGLGNEHLSSNYDRIKTEGLSPSFLHCVGNPCRRTALSHPPLPHVPAIRFPARPNVTKSVNKAWITFLMS